MLKIGLAWIVDFLQFEGAAIGAILLALYALGVFQQGLQLSTVMLYCIDNKGKDANTNKGGHYAKLVQ